MVNGTPVLAPIANSAMQFVVNANWPLFQVTRPPLHVLPVRRQRLADRHRTLAELGAPTSTCPQRMSQVPAESRTAPDLKPFIPAAARQRRNVPGGVLQQHAGGDHCLQWTAAVDRDSRHATSLRREYRQHGLQIRADRSLLLPYVGTLVHHDSTAGAVDVCHRTACRRTFARIPSDSPAGSSLASVPGTPEAEDAVLMAQIPTTVTVNPPRPPAEVKVSYVGQPQFLPITGTSMSYATNTPNRVIQVGAEYYLCYQGVWFVAGRRPQRTMASCANCAAR